MIKAPLFVDSDWFLIANELVANTLDESLCTSQPPLHRPITSGTPIAVDLLPTQKDNAPKEVERSPHAVFLEPIAILPTPLAYVKAVMTIICLTILYVFFAKKIPTVFKIICNELNY